MDTIVTSVRMPKIVAAELERQAKQKNLSQNKFLQEIIYKAIGIKYVPAQLVVNGRSVPAEIENEADESEDAFIEPTEEAKQPKLKTFKHYKAKEIHIIKRMSKDGATDAEIGAALGRTAKAIKHQRHSLRIKRQKKAWTDTSEGVPEPEQQSKRLTVGFKGWTSSDKKDLVTMFKDGHNDAEIGKALGRTTLAIKQKRKLLKLYKAHRKENWTQAEKGTLEDLWKTGAMGSDIASSLGRSELAVRVMAYKLGLKRRGIQAKIGDKAEVEADKILAQKEQIVKLVQQGMKDKEIAEILHMHHSTVADKRRAMGLRFRAKRGKTGKLRDSEENRMLVKRALDILSQTGREMNSKELELAVMGKNSFMGTAMSQRIRPGLMKSGKVECTNRWKGGYHYKLKEEKQKPQPKHPDFLRGRAAYYQKQGYNSFDAERLALADQAAAKLQPSITEQQPQERRTLISEFTNRFSQFSEQSLRGFATHFAMNGELRYGQAQHYFNEMEWEEAVSIILRHQEEFKLLGGIINGTIAYEPQTKRLYSK